MGGKKTEKLISGGTFIRNQRVLGKRAGCRK